jgi:hypothetical protein
LPVGESKASFAGDLGQNLNPPGSGGLLLALHIWQRLLTVGPEKFGEVYYLGTMPIPTRPGLVDTLVGLYGGVETHFHFDPASGHLVGLEMFSAEDADPCEIYFSDYREVEGRPLPHRWEIRCAGEVFAVLEIETYHLKAAEK